jgi:hypothetical protein
MSTATRWLNPSLALAAAVLLVQAANAGPPLICHPFTTENAPSLPWTGAPGWRATQAGYDVRRLTADTLALLGPNVPVLARMETMRRASIYASTNPQAATELLSALLALERAPARDPHAAALAEFDAGYLIESYRQQGEIDKTEMLTAFARSSGVPLSTLDGYALVENAVAMKTSDVAAMEFAASLMTTDKAAAARHRDSATAAATPGSLLARNISAAWGAQPSLRGAQAGPPG